MRVCLVSFSRIADDPRVRRQGDALASAGHDVVAVGLAGGRSPAPAWPVVEVSHGAVDTWRRKAAAALRMTAGGRVPSLLAPAVFASTSARRVMRALVDARASLYLANDWLALPFAAHAAQRQGRAYAYDSHEYGAEQHLDRRGWRLVFPAHIRAIEEKYLPGAAFITTVSAGIAELLRSDYGLAESPLVVRNLPPFVATPHRPPGAELTVLYHGVFHAGRGLETLVRSVQRWDPRFRLVLRGLGSPAEVAALRRAVAASPAASRIRLEPPVAPNELVQAASASDIGFFCVAPTTGHARYALPNKIFEYLMAGLALCVGDLPEITPLVARYDLGRTVTALDPDAIAAAINGFTTDATARFKRNALHAAGELSWEREQGVLLEAVARIAVGRT